MKYFKLTVMLILLLSSVTSRAAEVRADHRSDHRTDHRHPGHAHSRVFIGVPIWRPLYYPVPYYYYYPYYYPPVAATPALPPDYIEQGNGQAAQSNYWYYCTNPEGYYPYVKECPGGWQKVVPQPPPS